jgi:RNA polymerase sigma-70 factor (ECF subfamily)
MDKAADSYRRFLEGDERAIDAIMEELFFPLVFFVNRYVRDLPAAEDIAMDAMTELFVHRRRYNFKVTLKTYVFLLGKSRALNWLKHRKSLRETELIEAEDLAEESELERRALDSERKRTVNAALARLPEDQRLAVHLVYFEELSYEEAARIMKKDRKQVDNLLYRAKNALRAILGEEGKQLL